MLHERIKQARKRLEMTQEEFGSAIGLKQSAITSYETGVRTPSDVALQAMCREFNISKEWLLNGTGEMFQPGTYSQQITDFATAAIQADNSSLKKRLVLALSQLTDSQWDELQAFLDKLKEERE